MLNRLMTSRRVRGILLTVVLLCGLAEGLYGCLLYTSDAADE